MEKKESDEKTDIRKKEVQGIRRKRMRKITVRIDDVTEDMDWEKFHRFEALLDQYGIAPLIGVIPCNQDATLKKDTIKEDYAAWLLEKQAQGWVIAMHGHDHIYTTKKGGLFPLNSFSEFAGVSYEIQLDKLQKGRQAMKLLGLETDIFMAPAHSFDRNTVKALKACGFHYITDGFGKAPFERNRMTYLPIAVQKSREFGKKKGISTFVVHTATMREEDFAAWDKLFKEKREFFVNYGEMLQYHPIKQNCFQRGTEYILAFMKGLRGRMLSGES